MQPRNAVLLGQLGLVQKECTFNVGDHVCDDVLECAGIVLQLPLESETMNRGNQIELASEADAIWCTWDHCAVREGGGCSVNHACIIAARSGH